MAGQCFNAGITGIGDGSFEVYPDRSLRFFSTPAVGGPVIKQTAGGIVPVGVPVWLAYSRSDDGSQRAWVGSTKYQNDGDGGTWQRDDPDPAGPGAWPVPPVGNHTIFAFSGGAVQGSGLLAEVISWTSAKPTVEIESIGAEALLNQAWLDAGPIDFGTVEISTLVNQSFAPYVHPETGYTTIVDTQPASDATVAANGLTLDTTGASTAQAPETFTFHVTAGAASSTGSTGQIETVAGGVASAPVPDTNRPLFSKTSALIPAPTGDRLYSKTSALTPAPDTSNPLFVRQDP